jgi:hypothetical protein
MEQTLDVYRRPYDPRHPVICMDEQPKQLIRETRLPQPAASHRPARVDYEYVREGVCDVWMFVEPLAGWREVRVTPHRTAVDWALQVRALLHEPRYAQAERLTLVCDNLNTHTLASLYQAFEPAEAWALARRLELAYTPKHGSWLNMAESELSSLTRQCLDRRIPEQPTVADEAEQWARERNARQIGIDWQFTTNNARIKLRHLYPKVMM